MTEAGALDKAKRARPSSWLTCADAREWRGWLEGHHAQEADVWLRIRKAGSPEPGVTLQEAVAEALCFGWIDSWMYSQDEQGYVLRFSPRRPDSQWSLLNRTLADTLIAAGRMREAGMAAVHAAQANGRWEAAYTSRTAPEIPADLADALADDPEAAAGFDRWPNSRQLQYVFWIGQARTAETRRKRVRETVRAACAEKE